VKFEDVVSPDRVVVLSETDKESALRHLIRVLCGASSESGTYSVRELPEDRIAERVFEREWSVSSRVAPGIAIPHAVMEELPNTRLAIGLSRQGILWEPEGDHVVHLVFLLVGNPEQHLPVLSALAAHLRQGGLYEHLLDARGPDDLYRRFTQPEEEREGILTYRDRDISRVTFEQGIETAKRLGGAKLLVHADAIRDAEYLVSLVSGTEAMLVTANPNKFREENVAHLAERGTSVTVVPFHGMRRSTHVQFTLLFLLSENLLTQDDIVVNVFGIPGSGYFDSIRLTYVEREFDFPLSQQIPGHGASGSQHVLVRVLQLASELAAEGREGKAVGTMFVLGDTEAVMAHSRQLIVNPFAGTPEAHRNILDPNLEETIKEYAKIDGAFIIRDDGVIVAGGRYLSGTPQADELHPGLGARHAAGLAITAVSRAMAVVISESTRKMSLFHGGKRVTFM
jgi:mannitol/fructose-specific phosphotransferase system IIA component (Ntr-type)